MGGLTAGVEWHGRLTHAGDGYARHASGVVELLRDLAQGRRKGVPQLIGVVVGPAWFWEVGRSRRLAPSSALPVLSKATTLMFVVPTSAPIRIGTAFIG